MKQFYFHFKTWARYHPYTIDHDPDTLFKYKAISGRTIPFPTGCNTATIKLGQDTVTVDKMWCKVRGEK